MRMGVLSLFHHSVGRSSTVKNGKPSNLCDRDDDGLKWHGHQASSPERALEKSNNEPEALQGSKFAFNA